MLRANVLEAKVNNVSVRWEAPCQKHSGSNRVSNRAATGQQLGQQGQDVCPAECAYLHLGFGCPEQLPSAAGAVCSRLGNRLSPLCLLLPAGMSAPRRARRPTMRCTQRARSSPRTASSLPRASGCVALTAGDARWAAMHLRACTVRCDGRGGTSRMFALHPALVTASPPSPQCARPLRLFLA